jgi:hypothetical protein
MMGSRCRVRSSASSSADGAEVVKLGMRDRVELTRYAIRNGLVEV